MISTFLITGNRGEFIHDGPNTFWTPAMAEGKYIIFCLAKDRGSAEILTSKIINAKVGFGFTLVTDTLLYNTEAVSYTHLTLPTN